MKSKLKSDSPLRAATCSPFVVAPHTLQFRCETAVYRGDSGSSVCYVTCDEVGRFVAAALNHFADSGEMAKYLSENRRAQQLTPR
jgi:hypothetical protein